MAKKRVEKVEKTKYIVYFMLKSRNRSMKNHIEEDIRRILRRGGYEVIAIWACEKDAQIPGFAKKHQLTFGNDSLEVFLAAHH
jgi:hypothetical protein